MASVSSSVTINQPVEKVFSYVTGVENHKAWQAGILDAVTKGMGNTTTSWANIVGLNLNINNTLLVSADLIQSTAKAIQAQPASCPSGSAEGDAVGSTAYEATPTPKMATITAIF